MTTVEITATNRDKTRDAWYDVTVEFVGSDSKVVAVETAHLGKVAADNSATKSVYVARPTDGKELTARLRKVEREFVTENEAGGSQDKLDDIVEIFVREGLVAPGTSYGMCPDSAPQVYWIGAKANCWEARTVQPPPTSPAPQPLGGTLCTDGWVSGSSGRGTCSHHGGISR
ncbi:hypothetical protein ACIPSA_51095 [Streptomyces sp. NPDC086549]|uniref:hypothetical protein n=1 Tax=Streptomyces sp. NPDC086549 TaxID=3365752 RepID=UPI0038241D44